MMTLEPGDIVALSDLCGIDINGVVVDDPHTPIGTVAVVWKPQLCRQVWYIEPGSLELIRRAVEEERKI